MNFVLALTGPAGSGKEKISKFISRKYKLYHLDSGILYGYGVFETILVQEGKPVLMNYHYDRMMYGASLLEIHMTFVSAGWLAQAGVLH